MKPATGELQVIKHVATAEKAADLIAAHLPKVIFLVGAGVSRRGPSYLPDGLQLSKALLRATTDQAFFDQITLLYAGLHANGFAKPFPRPEAILETFWQIKPQSVVNCLEFMVDGIFNANHLALSKCLTLGAKVFTTNFDLLIEQANTRMPNNIVHLHGRIDDPPSIVGTIRTVTRPLRVDLASSLRDAIVNAELLVVLGYSGSDRFDITPALQQAGLIANGEILWVQHGSAPHTLARGVREIIKEWGERQNVVYCDTGFLLDRLAAAIGSPADTTSPQIHDEDWWQVPLQRSAARAFSPEEGHLVALSLLAILHYGESAETYLSRVNAKALTEQGRLLLRRLTVKSLKNTAKYRSALLSSVKLVGWTGMHIGRPFNLIDLTDNLIVLTVECRNYGQRDLIWYCISLIPLFSAWSMLTLARILEALRGRSSELSDEFSVRSNSIRTFLVQFLWFFVQWEGYRHSVNLSLVEGYRRGRLFEWFAKRLSIMRSRLVRESLWVPEHRGNLLRTATGDPEVASEAYFFEEEIEGLGAQINNERDRIYIEISAKLKSATREDTRRWIERAGRLLKASELLGDIPGQVKAHLLISRLALVADDSDSLGEHHLNMAHRLISGIEWSWGTKRFWLSQVAEVRHQIDMAG